MQIHRFLDLGLLSVANRCAHPIRGDFDLARVVDLHDRDLLAEHLHLHDVLETVRQEIRRLHLHDDLEAHEEDFPLGGYLARGILVQVVGTTVSFDGLFDDFSRRLGLGDSAGDQHRTNG